MLHPFSCRLPLNTARQKRNYIDYKARLGLSSREWERIHDQEVRWWHTRDCRATLGSLPLFGGKGEPAAAGKSLNVGLWQPLHTTYGAERMKEAERGPWCRLYWQDLIVAKNTMSHLHRHNEQKSFPNQRVGKSLISGLTQRKAAKVGKNSQLQRRI